MCDNLLSQKAIKQWDLQVEHAPVELQSRVMEPPRIFKGSQIIHCDENVLRNLPIQKSVNLLKEKWIMIYQHSKMRSNFEIADNVYNTMRDACKKLGIKVEEPEWIEMDREDDMMELKHKLREYMVSDKDGIFKHPTICVAVLGYEPNYPAYKEVF